MRRGKLRSAQGIGRPRSTPNRPNGRFCAHTRTSQTDRPMHDSVAEVQHVPSLIEVTDEGGTQTYTSGLRSVTNREQPPDAGRALEFALASVVEFDAGTGEERRDRARDENLARGGDFGDPSSDVDGDAANVVTHELDLTRMETARHAHAQAGCYVANGTSAIDRTSGTIEGREEVVASSVHLPTAEAEELGANCRAVALEKAAPCLVAQPGSCTG